MNRTATALAMTSKTIVMAREELLAGVLPGSVALDATLHLF